MCYKKLEGQWGRGGFVLFHHQYKTLLKHLDRNKAGDIAEGYRNNFTANACHNHVLSWSVEFILQFIDICEV